MISNYGINQPWNCPTSKLLLHDINLVCYLYFWVFKNCLSYLWLSLLLTAEGNQSGSMVNTPFPLSLCTCYSIDRTENTFFFIHLVNFHVSLKINSDVISQRNPSYGNITSPRVYCFSLWAHYAQSTIVFVVLRIVWCVHSPLPSLYLEGRCRVLFSLFLQLLGQSLAQNKPH